MPQVDWRNASSKRRMPLTRKARAAASESRWEKVGVPSHKTGKSSRS
jgi:hypothetical protein